MQHTYPFALNRPLVASLQLRWHVSGFPLGAWPLPLEPGLSCPSFGCFGACCSLVGWGTSAVPVDAFLPDSWDSATALNRVAELLFIGSARFSADGLLGTDLIECLLSSHPIRIFLEPNSHSIGGRSSPLRPLGTLHDPTSSCPAPPPGISPHRIDLNRLAYQLFSIPVSSSWQLTLVRADATPVFHTIATDPGFCQAPGT
jgi:hypothetical protein